MKCLALTIVGLLGAVPAFAQEAQSFPLSTDTPQYCAGLVKQVSERRSMVLDVQRLLAEGREMCDRGEIRGGIRRLRRALVILHHKTMREE